MSVSGPGAADRDGGPLQPPASVPLTVIAREWGRIGVTGFGGPPAHIALLRELCVRRHAWLAESEFEDGIAAASLLPGPASTQLAIFCAWRLAGPVGAMVGGVCFIAPGLIIILGLSVLFLAKSPPTWVRGAALGAGAAVPAVAVSAAGALLPASWRRAGTRRAARVRWMCYLLAGAIAANLAGQFLVAVLLGCGLAEGLGSQVAVRGGGGAGAGGAGAGRADRGSGRLRRSRAGWRAARRGHRVRAVVRVRAGRRAAVRPVQAEWGGAGVPRRLRACRNRRDPRRRRYLRPGAHPALAGRCAGRCRVLAAGAAARPGQRDPRGRWHRHHRRPRRRPGLAQAPSAVTAPAPQ